MSIKLPSASTAKDGIITNSAQTIAGDKTFTGNIVVSATTFVFTSDTTDGADNKRMNFAGGGAASASRGSYINLNGNEFGSGVGGWIAMEAGNSADAAGANTALQLTGAATGGGANSVILKGTGAGAWSLGPSVTSTTSGQAHIINGAINSGGTGTSAGDRLLKLIANAHDANSWTRPRVTGITGAAFLLNDSSAAFLFQTNQSGDGATAATATVGSASVLGAWTFGVANGSQTHTIHGNSISWTSDTSNSPTLLMRSQRTFSTNGQNICFLNGVNTTQAGGFTDMGGIKILTDNFSSGTASGSSVNFFTKTLAGAVNEVGSVNSTGVWTFPTRVVIGSATAYTFDLKKTVAGDWLGAIINPSTTGYGLFITSGSTSASQEIFKIRNNDTGGTGAGNDVTVIQANGATTFGVVNLGVTHTFNGASLKLEAGSNGADTGFDIKSGVSNIPYIGYFQNNVIRMQMGANVGGSPVTGGATGNGYIRTFNTNMIMSWDSGSTIFARYNTTGVYETYANVASGVSAFHIVKNSGSVGSSDYMNFRHSGTSATGGTLYGGIRSNAGNTAFEFFFSSDSRLKENVETIENGLDKITALRPVTFDWIGGTTGGRGFIAQEVQAVIPEMIGTYDNGGETYYNLGTSELIPLLVAAIKELKARVEALEA